MSSYSGLIIDIAIIAVLIPFGIGGYRKGLFVTVIGILRWILAIVFATFAYPYIKGFLIEKTQIETNLTSHIAVSITSGLSDTPEIFSFLPSEFSKALMASGEDAIQKAAASIAGTVISIISFLAALIFFTLITFFIIKAITGSKSKGIIGGIDGFFGLIFGLLKGSLIICLIFLVMVPVLSLLGPEVSEPAFKAIHDSVIADTLYYSNPLLEILK